MGFLPWFMKPQDTLILELPKFCVWLVGVVRDLLRLRLVRETSRYLILELPKFCVWLCGRSS